MKVFASYLNPFFICLLWVGNQPGAQEAKPDPPAVTVDGAPIPFSRFVEKAGALTPKPKTKVEIKESKEHIVNALIVEQIQEGLAAAIPVWDEPAFRQRVEKQLVQVALGELAGKLLTNAVTVSDSEVRAYFDTSTGQFDIPERVKASHILIAPMKDSSHVDSLKKAQGLFLLTLEAAHGFAERLYGVVARGGAFDSLARLYSDDRLSGVKGGDLGYFAYDEMEEPFAKAAFGMQPGEISRPVQTKYGYHIIKVWDHQPAGKVPLSDSVRTEITRTLQTAKVQIRSQAVIDSLRHAARVTFNDSVIAHSDSVRNSDLWVAIVNERDTVRFAEFWNQLGWLRFGRRPEDSVNFAQKHRLVEQLLSAVLLKQAALITGCFEALSVQAARAQMIAEEQKRRIEKQFQLDYEPSEQELIAYYDAHREEYKEAEPLHVQHIIFKDSSLARSVRDSIVRLGLDFAAMAKKYYPGDPDIRGVAFDLGFISPQAMPKAFFDAASGLGIGEVSQPVKTEWGYHLIKLVNRQTSKSFGAVRSDIAKLLIDRHLAQVRAKRAAEARKEHKIKVNKKLIDAYQFAPEAPAAQAGAGQPAGSR